MVPNNQNNNHHNQSIQNVMQPSKLNVMINPNMKYSNSKSSKSSTSRLINTSNTQNRFPNQQ